MTKFLLIRHGEIDNEAVQRYAVRTNNDSPWHDGIPLSERGVCQITDLVTEHCDRFARAELIISSPFSRTLHSAIVISTLLYLPIKVEFDLHDITAPESLNDVWERVSRVIAQYYQYEKVIVVTHSAVIRAAKGVDLDTPLAGLFTLQKDYSSVGGAK